MNTHCFTEPIPKNISNSGVYLIHIAHHKYIGSTKNFYERLQTHRKQLRKGNCENKKFINAYNKYGESACFWEILELCTSDDKVLKQREEYWINALNSDLNINKYPTKYPSTIIYNQKHSSKPVYRYNLNGDYIDKFTSAREAERQLNIDSNYISQVCRKQKSYLKSAGGFQWSYEKKDKLDKYINNSDKAKIVSIFIFDCYTGEEFKFNSIADAVRQLNINGKNFDSSCATISSGALHHAYINQRYLSRYENQLYKLPTRNKFILDTEKLIVYSDLKSACKAINSPVQTLKKLLKSDSHPYLHYLNVVARVKFRESGKLHLLDNPNPSSVEIQ